MACAVAKLLLDAAGLDDRSVSPAGTRRTLPLHCSRLDSRRRQLSPQSSPFQEALTKGPKLAEHARLADIALAWAALC